MNKTKVYSELHYNLIRKELTVPLDPTIAPNVLLFVIDSLSQSNFRRQLPLFISVLTEEKNFTLMTGFNRVSSFLNVPSRVWTVPSLCS